MPSLETRIPTLEPALQFWAWPLDRLSIWVKVAMILGCMGTQLPFSHTFLGTSFRQIEPLNPNACSCSLCKQSESLPAVCAMTHENKMSTSPLLLSSQFFNIPWQNCVLVGRQLIGTWPLCLHWAQPVTSENQCWLYLWVVVSNSTLGNK